MTLFLFEFYPHMTLRLTFQARKAIGSLAGFLGQILRIFLMGWRSTLPYIMVLSITPRALSFHTFWIFILDCVCVLLRSATWDVDAPMLAWYPSWASETSDDELLNAGRNKGESSRSSCSPSAWTVQGQFSRLIGLPGCDYLAPRY